MKWITKIPERAPLPKPYWSWGYVRTSFINGEVLAARFPLWIFMRIYFWFLEKVMRRHHFYSTRKEFRTAMKASYDRGYEKGAADAFKIAKHEWRLCSKPEVPRS
jgi:hypothetical protein